MNQIHNPLNDPRIRPSDGWALPLLLLGYCVFTTTALALASASLSPLSALTMPLCILFCLYSFDQLLPLMDKEQAQSARRILAINAEIARIEAELEELRRNDE